MKKFLSCFIIFLLIAACSGSKSMLKKGFKLDEAGMKTEAVEYYIDALVRKKTNVDAKIALKKTGQNVLDDKLADFFQAQATSDHKKAVYTYLDAVKFRDRVQFVGVNLDLPESYNQMYEESKSIYINQLYSSANEDLRKENYQEAKSKLDEVQVLSPNFKDAFKLSTEAFQQPLYNRAIEAYNSGDYREAYYLFEQINSKGNFKDSRNLQEICQENGRYTVGLLAIENRTSHKPPRLTAQHDFQEDDSFAMRSKLGRHRNRGWHGLRPVRSCGAVRCGEVCGAEGASGWGALCQCTGRRQCDTGANDMAGGR